jgi:cytochrome P450
MLNTTGPEHTRLCKLVTKSFTPRMIENRKPSIERTVDALLDPIAEAGGGNVLEALGFPLPVTIIGEMLGVPEADPGANFARWCATWWRSSRCSQRCNTPATRLPPRTACRPLGDRHR